MPAVLSVAFVYLRFSLSGQMPLIAVAVSNAQLMSLLSVHFFSKNALIRSSFVGARRKEGFVLSWLLNIDTYGQPKSSSNMLFVRSFIIGWGWGLLFGPAVSLYGFPWSM